MGAVERSPGRGAVFRLRPPPEMACGTNELQKYISGTLTSGLPNELRFHRHLPMLWLRGASQKFMETTPISSHDLLRSMSHPTPVSEGTRGWQSLRMPQNEAPTPVLSPIVET